MRIVFITEALVLGGKERRLLELIRYLQDTTDYEMLLVITDSAIHYDYVRDFKIKIEVLERKYFKRDPLFFFKLFNVYRKFRPDIIHSWSSMTTCYSIPYAVVHKTPIVDGEINDSRRGFSTLSLRGLIFTLNTYFSKVILANSHSGLRAYRMTSPKARVIYNGIHLGRFTNLPDPLRVRAHYGVSSRYCVAMAASFDDRKNYNLFIDTAKLMYRLRTDVTFIGIGDGPNLQAVRERVSREQIQNVLLPGKLTKVEELMNCADVGLLTTGVDYHEGISNALMEFMALGKPVITNDFSGGSKELVEDGGSGYVVSSQEPEYFVSLIDELLQDESRRRTMGQCGKSSIAERFTLAIMGSRFVNLYSEILST